MKKSLLLCFFVSVSVAVFAQKGNGYTNAVGGRFGSTYYDVLSFSYKNFINGPNALEFNLGFGARGYGSDNASTLAAALSYQRHFDFDGAAGLKWFIGAGATVFNTFAKNNRYSGFGLGIFPTAGLDYKFNGVPINLTLDLRPTFHLVSPSYYNPVYGNLGFAIRYTLQ